MALGVATPVPRYFALRDLDTQLAEHDLAALRRNQSYQGVPIGIAQGRYLSAWDEAHVRGRRAEVAVRFWIHVAFGAALCLTGAVIAVWPRLDAAARGRQQVGADNAGGEGPWGFVAPGAAIGAVAGALLGWLPSRPLAAWVIDLLSLPPDGAIWLVCWLCCGLAAATAGGYLGYQFWRMGGLED